MAGNSNRPNPKKDKTVRRPRGLWIPAGRYVEYERKEGAVGERVPKKAKRNWKLLNPGKHGNKPKA